MATPMFLAPARALACATSGATGTLTPGRYVGLDQEQDEREPVKVKVQRLVVELHGRMVQATLLNDAANGSHAAVGLGGSRF